MGKKLISQATVCYLKQYNEAGYSALDGSVLIHKKSKELINSHTAFSKSSVLIYIATDERSQINIMATINSSGNFKDRNATVIIQLMNLDWQNCDHIQRLKVDATILTIYCVCLLVHDSLTALHY